MPTLLAVLLAVSPGLLCADEVQAPKPRDQAKPAPANPLGEIIRGLFGPARRKPVDLTPDGQEEPEPANGDETARDRIDARAPYDIYQAKRLRTAADHLEKAAATQQESDWRTAMDLLQKVLEQPEDSLVRRPDGEWVSVRREANRMLADLPPNLLEHYRRQNGALARQLLDEARRDADLDKAVDVATRFFHTPAGRRAANFLGTLHFDRGEFGLAARWFGQLLEAGDPIADDPRWQVKAAFVFRESGRTAEMQRLQERPSGSSPRPVRIGGTQVQPDRWLAGTGGLKLSNPALDDWPMLFGNPSHTGRATGGEPLLLPRWSQLLTNSHPIREQIEEITYDLAHDGKAAVPAFFPLMVNGKVVFRTMRGVRVVEADSGRVLWETREGDSPERLLAGRGPNRLAEEEFQQAIFVNGNRWLTQQRGGDVEYHPLTSLLFRDGVWGTISSDGRRLFVLEDHAILSHHQPGNHWSFREGIRDPYRRDWSSNKLVAYDLETGRARWEVGGQILDEPFDRRLAGFYFFGAPTPDGDELFVVGEKESEIRLFSLDPETGRPNWSQLIAYSDSKIEQDVGRRWWTAQVAVSNGVLVCPTTVGWLVGVDRMNRSVLWAHRYSRPGQTQHRGDPRGANLVPNAQLNQLWGPSAPVIAGNRVVYTPPDSLTPGSPSQQELVCLNLFDGAPAWQKPKGSFLYLAGVFDERVVLVGSDSVAALALEDGASLWSAALTNTRPSGMGVAVGNRYYLPLQSAELWAIDLEAGEVRAKLHCPDGADPLGNIGMSRGMLVSLSPSGLTSFEQREAVLAEIARRKAQDPDDAWALLREADMLILSRRYADALAALRRIRAERLPKTLQPHFREVMIDSLAAVIRSDLQGHQKALEELGRFVKTPDERLLHRRLVAEQLQSRREYEAAFDVYLDLLREGADRFVARGDETNTRVRLSHWVAGELASLWDTMSPEHRARLDERIEALADDALAGEAAAQERFVTVFAFHPAAVRVSNHRIEQDAVAGEFLRAEAGLLRLSRSDDPMTAAAAFDRVARLMAEFELPKDAAYFDRILEQRYPEVALADGRSVQALLEERRRSGELGADRRRSSDWGDFDLKLEVTGTNYSSNVVRELHSGQSRLPFFRDHRFLFFQQHQRLGILAADESMHWMLPLRMSSRGGSGSAVSEQVGHALFVVHGGVLHALSPVERRVLWTKTLGARSGSPGYHRSPLRDASEAMQVGTAIASRSSLRRSSTFDGMLAVANSEYVCTYDRRTATICDALTGEVLWTRDRIPPNTALAGNEKVLFVIPQGNDPPLALRAIDGKPLDVPELAEHLGKAISIGPDGLVQVESGTSSSLLGLSRANLVIRRFDPLRDKEHWRVEFPNNTYLSLLDDDRLAALELSGRLHLVDLQTGETTKFEVLPESALKYRAEMHVLTDDERVYLIVNQSRRRSYYFSSNGVPALNVNGTVYAFDRQGGRKLWEQKVLNQQLLQEQIHHAPVLVFSSREYERQGNFGTWATSLLVLDKRTGRQLIDTKLSSQNSGGFQSLKLDLAERTLELVSYNQRLRLVAVARDEEPVEAPKEMALAR